MEQDPDWEILHDEIDSLPERLGAPIVLCYLQGMTYDAAADAARAIGSGDPGPAGPAASGCAAG